MGSSNIPGEKKYIQSSKHGMRKFPNYEKSMGEHKQFPNSAQPHRFRINDNLYNSHYFGGINSLDLDIFCGKPCHSQTVDFWGN